MMPLKSPLIDDSDELKSSFMLALSFHLIIFLGFYLFSKIKLNMNSHSNVEIVKQAVRVDVVGMPKLTLEELKELKELSQDKSAGSLAEFESTRSDEPLETSDLESPEAKVTAKKSLLNFLQNMSQKKIAIDTKPSKGKNLNLDSLILEGNKISKGSALTGESAEQEMTAFVLYVQALPDFIRKNWKLPDYLRAKNLKARIKVWINKEGLLIKAEVIETSGQKEFDLKAENAIRLSSPFPKPDKEVAARLSSQGIIMGFPL